VKPLITIAVLFEVCNGVRRKRRAGTLTAPGWNADNAGSADNADSASEARGAAKWFARFFLPLRNNPILLVSLLTCDRLKFGPATDR